MMELQSTLAVILVYDFLQSSTILKLKDASESEVLMAVLIAVLELPATSQNGLRVHGAFLVLIKQMPLIGCF